MYALLPITHNEWEDRGREGTSCWVSPIMFYIEGEDSQVQVTKTWGVLSPYFRNSGSWPCYSSEAKLLDHSLNTTII